LNASADRIHFLDEQRRNRRMSRGVAVLVVLALVVSGIPLSVFISPALVMLAVIAAYIADIFITVPPNIWEALRETVFVLPETWRAIRSDTVDMPWRTLFYLLVVPGTIVIFIIWAFMRILFRRTGVGGVLRNLGARRPSADVEERRIVNLVEEISVAAGVPPPRTLMIDSSAANAVAVGLHMGDATIVVSTGLTSRLSRDEAQAVIAHVISSVGNGDLRIAAAVFSALQSWGFVALLLDTPLGSHSRRALRLVTRNAVQAARRRQNVGEAEIALNMLLAGSENPEDLLELCDAIEAGRNMHPLAELFFTVPLLLTMGVASVATRMVVWMFTLLVAGPWIAMMWRSRRRLADASAVQLTRNPDALAGALRELATTDVKIPGAVTVNFLFPVWDKDVDRDEKRTDIASTLLGMHLDHDKRLVAVTKLGAQPEATDGQPASFRAKLAEFARDLPGFLKWLAIGVVLMVLLVIANLVAVSCAIMVAWWMLKVVFVTIPGWVRAAVG